MTEERMRNQEMVAKYFNGVKVRELAGEYGISSSRVWGILGRDYQRRNGRTRRRGRPCTKGIYPELIDWLAKHEKSICELAGELYYAPTTVRKVLRGERNMTPEMRERIAEVTGIFL